MTYSQEHAQLLLEVTMLRQIIAEQKEQIVALIKENQELKEKLGTNEPVFDPLDISFCRRCRTNE